MLSGELQVGELMPSSELSGDEEKEAMTGAVFEVPDRERAPQTGLGRHNRDTQPFSACHARNRAARVRQSRWARAVKRGW
jgi:hypothetical protein